MRIVTWILAALVFVAVLVFDMGAVARFAIVSVIDAVGYQRLAILALVIVAGGWIVMRLTRRPAPPPPAPARRKRAARPDGARVVPKKAARTPKAPEPVGSRPRRRRSRASPA